MNSKLELSDVDFNYFRDLIFNLAGIHLSVAKKDLIVSRLRNHIKELGLSDLEDYKKYLQAQKPKSPEFQKFINLLTTNKTDFFREPEHFEFLVKTFLPEWLKHGRKVLNIWSCASSTGEEIYTLAMVLNLHLPKHCTFKILATDIDSEVLKTAANGVYPISKLHEIPADYQKSSVALGTAEISQRFKIKNVIKEKVIFKQHNLMDQYENTNEVFDIIFCRNVLIYFTKETIEQVVHKLLLKTTVGGYLLIGHSESLSGIKTNWKNLQPSIYKRVDDKTQIPL